MSEANDVETWIKERTEFVSNADYGKDESASDKLLAKHKVRACCLVTSLTFLFHFRLPVVFNIHVVEVSR